MTKCGKSVLPECEYFATNGCVSPFNCPYKVENESITTATSTPFNLYPLETDKDKEISRLQAENAELRARLKELQEGKMKVIKMPNIKPIKCRTCGCEYEYEQGDELVKVNKRSYYGEIPDAFLYFLECPVCGRRNELCFDENEEEGKQWE